MEVVGWIGAFLFAICGVPQAYQSYKDKHSNGINSLFLICWLLGEFLTLIYILFDTANPPLIFNYIINIICTAIIGYYKWK